MSSWFVTYGFADVLDDLLIGAYPLDEEDVSILERMGVKRVLNLVADDEYQQGEHDAVRGAYDEAGIAEERIGLTDFGGLPPDQLDAAVALVSEWLDQGERTYLHCRAGWQRAASIAAGVVAVREGLDVEQALEYVQRRKPTADPLPHQREDLRTWWQQRGVAKP